MSYGTFCPLSKSCELLCERWTFLILNEMHFGSSRFNDFQKTLSGISPTMLSRRLGELEQAGIIVKRKIPGQKGYEYFLSKSGKESWPIIEQLGAWGMRWARGQLEDTELDVELLTTYMTRSIEPEHIIGNEAVISIHFQDLDELSRWWIVVEGKTVDLCLHDPKKEINIWINSDLKTMVSLWMGDESFKKAIRENRLKLIGDRILVKTIEDWMGKHPLSHIRPEDILG